VLPVADEKRLGSGCDARTWDCSADRSWTRPTLPQVHERADEPPLKLVRVLELVEEQVMVAGLQAKAALGELASLLEEAHRLEEHVGEIEPRAGAFELGEARGRLAVEGLKLLDGVEVLFADPLPIDRATPGARASTASR
jgi:hypothetical protein